MVAPCWNWFAAALFAAVPVNGVDGPWHDAAGLKSALDELTGAHAGIARVASYGKSRGGRELWYVELGPVDDPLRARKPALLVVAGLDGQHLAGTEAVLDHLKRLVNDGVGGASDPAVKKLLEEHVVYLIPRANPDGAEAYFLPPGGVRRELRGNLGPVDDDRDGAADEDGPQDLNGDGVITQMRWKDPAGTWIEDPADPRAMKVADPLKGERGIWKVGPEGIDRDGDGECAEDGVGDVVPARNFPQRWAEFDPAAGRVPMSEPETLALGQFLFDRPAIALVVVYGLHDNLAVDAKQDSGGDAGPGPGGGGGGGGFRFSRSLPAGIVKDDQALYGELATRYREATGVTSKPALDAEDGAFWAFSYFQFGVPTLAMHLWSPPLDLKKPEEKKDEKKDEAKPADGEAAAKAEPPKAEAPKPETPKPEAPKADEAPAAEGGGRPGRGRGFGRGGGEGGAPGGADAKKSDGDEPKLLLWNDQKMSGAAFVPWTKVQHPTLGEVEVGGFKPYVRVNPPESELAELTKKHSDFLIKLGGLFAALRIEDPKIENLGGGLFRVTAAIVNDGWLPSVCGMGERCRRPKPTRLDLEPGSAKLVQGERRHTWQKIEGTGGRREVKWLLQADPGTTITLHLWSEKAGDAERAFKLQ